MEILKYPNPTLKKVSAPLIAVGEADRTLLKEMAKMMYLSHGVGLAAPQIGISKKLIVVDIGDKNLLCLINPVITKVNGKEEMEEGCLSVPNVYISIKRPRSITVKALNENGQPLCFEATGFLARAISHEIDHLNGKLIIDHVNPIKRFQLLKKNGYLKKIKQVVHAEDICPTSDSAK
jgi:peptide deformylase